MKLFECYELNFWPTHKERSEKKKEMPNLNASSCLLRVSFSQPKILFASRKKKRKNKNRDRICCSSFFPILVVWRLVNVSGPTTNWYQFNDTLETKLHRSKIKSLQETIDICYLIEKFAHEKCVQTWSFLRRGKNS